MKKLYNIRDVEGSLIIIWIALVYLSFFLGYRFTEHVNNFSPFFLNNFANWDGNYYVSIARSGYLSSFQYAFFPLFPILIRFFTLAIPNFIVVAILINSVSAVLGLYFLKRLLILKFDKKLSKSTLINILVFPVSFYFLVVYSEGLFFLLSTLSFYFLYRKKLPASFFVAGLCLITKITGLAVVLALIYFLWYQKKKKTIFFLVPISLGFFIIFCGYLFYKTGNPVYFLQAEGNWQRSLTFPGIAIPLTIYNLSLPDVLRNNLNALFALGVTVLSLGLSFRSIRFLPKELSVYSLLAITVPLLTPTVSSMPRYILPIFPVFVTLSLIKKPGIIFLYRVISFALLVFFSGSFISGYWVS